ncbi:LiaF transmembrane domain-containing protein [Pontibacter flavimaris]|uniref:LiaF transmembrane domain-containing protein n=1 Tax=Pontibacter flavimaris TaxID=1797110 RepID=A0A1Q5PFK7_9BACT|nr:DUF5668 domain-containing protein [Pontibacter flavimaris]OKL41025.1 hypothetical protein A3841_14445 [Pontibacter flavimaris]
MENRNQTPNSHYGNNWPEHRGGSSGKVMAGLLLIAVGVVVLASKLHIFFLPGWMFSWQMLLIVIGLFVGFRQNFRKSGWLVLVLIGTVFLINDLVAGFNLRIYFWPILLIGIGLWVMLKPRNRFGHRFAPPAPGGEAPYQPYAAHQPDSNQPGPGAYTDAYTDTAYSTEDMVDATAILGGIKKNIVSKNFLGGEVVSVFGGTELNLSQADMQHPVILEATQIFGGTTLIIPPHWQVKSEMVAILGGIDDKRPMLPDGYDPNKVLILKGTTLFGGLNIKSY